MKIVPVDRVLEPEGLLAPALNALLPNEHNYTVLLFQPKAQIEADATGVRNRNKNLAETQFGKFLAEAHETQPDLVVTPEYSVPWRSLKTVVQAGKVPVVGKIWALGCESITYTDLQTLKSELADTATVIFEQLTPQPARFTDPLVYVFLAAPNSGNGPPKTVMLVQFKTSPMRDPFDFEVNSLHKGTQIYQFGKKGEGLRLVSLICSDVFEFMDADAQEIYDRTLVINIQLNPNPRQPRFRAYRDHLLDLSGEQTEILCLNWAMHVSVYTGEQEAQWNNISASAWYLKPSEFDGCDTTLSANHRRGLYYTWCEPVRAHALFFNFAPATFLVTASKVAHVAIPAVKAHRRGPQLTKTCAWDAANSTWTEQLRVPDGFDTVVGESGYAKDRLKEISDANPFDVERILALCAGETQFSRAWHSVTELDSCIIDKSEVTRRITFCQDPDQDAERFRVRRLKRCAEVCRILRDLPLLPAIKDLKDGFRLEWLPTSPHQNVISVTGYRATVMYMSDDASEAAIKRAFTTAAENLRTASASAEEGRKAQQRLALWYLRDGILVQHEPHRFAQIDQAGDNSMLDYTRQE